MQHLELNGRPLPLRIANPCMPPGRPESNAWPNAMGPAVSDVTIDTAAGEFQLAHNILIILE
jgi:hypothetical protein